MIFKVEKYKIHRVQGINPFFCIFFKRGKTHTDDFSGISRGALWAGIATRARAFARLASLPRDTPLEVDDQVGSADHRVAPGGSDAGVGIAVEGRRVERPVVGDLRTHLDLRREPVLP